MATKQFYATGSFKYGTRMLRAGDGPIPMDGPTARLYTALGKISPNKPRTNKIVGDADIYAGAGESPTVTIERKPAAKRASRKRTTKKAK